MELSSRMAFLLSFIPRRGRKQCAVMLVFVFGAVTPLLEGSPLNVRETDGSRHSLTTGNEVNAG
jgi:hypothetical protein